MIEIKETDTERKKIKQRRERNEFRESVTKNTNSSAEEIKDNAWAYSIVQSSIK
jgi:hypothetical protein